MRVGIPREIKSSEFRVGMSPAGVREFVARGHRVVVEAGAGEGIGAADDDYRAAGAAIAPDAAGVFEQADLLIKVKEPQPSELAMLRERHILFTYLHLAPDPAQASALIGSGCTAIAYETVTDAAGGLPLLTPMSEVAGRLAIGVAGHWLMRAHGGRGVLLGGVPGVPPARIAILGCGTVGLNAARTAAGMGADVTVLDAALPRLRHADELLGGRVRTRFATAQAVAETLREADAVVGAALVPGASAPRLVTRDMLRTLPPRAVLVDVSIDQGGCFETSRPTTHADPVFEVDGILHYCVANMPGAVPRTSSHALNQAVLPYALALAGRGIDALRDDAGLRNGLNVRAGRIAHPAVAASLGLPFADPLSLL